MSAAITALTPDPRRPRMVVVQVAGKRTATLSQKTVERLALTVGQAWDAPTAQQVAAEVDYEKHLAQASRWLDRRMLSQAEVQAKLTKADCVGPLAGRVLGRLTELGVIDDRQLGQLLVEAQSARQPAGPARLRAKLLARGLDESLAEELIASAAPSAGATVEQALSLARQKMSAWANLDAPTRQRRLAGLLARRGFDEHTIEDVLERLEGDY